MTVNQRIEALVLLGDNLSKKTPELMAVLERASVINPWYTVPNSLKQLDAIVVNLKRESLSEWLAPFEFSDYPQNVGLILAGNIPLVGFHDIISVLLAGFRAQIKLSSDDAGLTAYVLKILVEIEPSFAERINVTDRLKNFDAIIATGSDNSSRYFDYYFGKKPNIIRGNRNSVAILRGDETERELAHLGNDVFDYFGLGCRSISKLFVPKGFQFSHLFESIEDFSGIRDHFKYSNNYDYNKSIFLINGDKHYDNGFLLVKEDERIASPLAVLYFQEYESIEELKAHLEVNSDKIQCITTSVTIDTSIQTFPLGESQSPTLTDYADGVNTLAFLKEFAAQI